MKSIINTFLTLLIMASCIVIYNVRVYGGGNPHISKSQKFKVIDIGRPVGGEYKSTDGLLISGRAAPYVTEYSKINAIDMASIGNALFPKGFPKPSESTKIPVFISSYQHINHTDESWTYIKSNTIVFYELLKIRIGDFAEPIFVVLFSHLIPEKIIIDQFEAEWRLALLDKEYKVISDQPFTVKIKYHEEGLWDMIYTDLSIKRGMIVVKIMYAHTGGGGGRDQEFTFWFAAQDKPVRLELKKHKQTLDEYY